MSDQPTAGGEPPVPGWPAESAQRLEKAAAVRAMGVALYPTRYERTHRLGEIVAAYEDKSLEALEALSVPVRIAGRVMTKRGHGKASFATLSDGDTRLQIYVREDAVGEEQYRLFDLVDLGDFVGVAGKVMRTRKGELSVLAEELTFLSKALLPLPEKWHGISDVELRYRQRYLDLVASPEVRQVFVDRAAIISETRRFLDGRGYIEVETPMMQPIAGGAMARPFLTHHNALDLDLYLRIAPELYLKRLVVGGLERVYEINRNFRNEGIDSNHNPEFTMLEFYTAYFDCADVMDTTEALLLAAAARVRADRPIAFRGREVSWKAPFARVAMVDAVFRELTAGPAALPIGSRKDIQEPRRLDPIVASAAFRRRCEHEGVSPEVYEGLSHGRRIAQLFEDFVEETLWDPTFVTDHPAEISPLAKAHPDDPATADRFELFVAGMELANGFSELNDPLEQRERFLDQLRQREKGDAEAHQMDEDYVRALGHGLPPTGGCGVGIDRLAMVLTNSPSIRDVILFPHMRPEGGRPKETDSTATPQGPPGSRS
jgi:lysyl-tRNA synthetase, class II